MSPTSTPATTAPADHRPERQLLAALRRDHRPPLGLGALDVGLLVRDGRRPSGRTQLVVGDDPRVRVYDRRPGGIGPRWNRHRSAPTTSATRSGSGSRNPCPVSARTRSPGMLPSGATLNTSSSRAVTASATADATSSWWTNWASGSASPNGCPNPAVSARGERRRAVGGDRDSRTQHRHRAARRPRRATPRSSPRQQPADVRTRTSGRDGARRPR